LVTSMFIGRRLEFFRYDCGNFPASNLPLATIGACFLAVGWFGFNGGSAFVAGGQATTAIICTQIGMCACGMVWMFLSWLRDRRAPGLAALMNGAVAGLAGITPLSGYLAPAPALVVGVILGVVSFVGVANLKHKLHIDDALEVCVVHGATGAVGAFLIGFLATNRAAGSGFLAVEGLFYSHSWQLVGSQVIGIAVAAAYAGVMTLVILNVLEYALGGIRLSPAKELAGTDWSEHGEVAYHGMNYLDDEALLDKATQLDLVKDCTPSGVAMKLRFFKARYPPTNGHTAHSHENEMTILKSINPETSLPPLDDEDNLSARDSVIRASHLTRVDISPRDQNSSHQRSLRTAFSVPTSGTYRKSD